VRVLQVGAGSWGSSWAQIVTGAPSVELTGIVDLDPGELARVGDLVGAPPERRFRSLGEAVARVEADAALVVVPPAAHAAVAREALEAGLHCLVEKPFTLRLPEAEELVRRAEDLGLILMVNQDQRYTRGARTVRRLVAEEALGCVGAIRVRFSQAATMKPYHVELAEPLLLDMAVHHFDQLRALGGQIDRVWARTFNPTWSPLAGNAAADVLFEADGGRTFVTYSATWAPRGRSTSWSGEWELQGDRGTIVWDGDRVELTIAEEQRSGRWRRRPRVRRVALDRLGAEDRLGSLAEFAAALNEARQPETSGRDNLGTLAVVLAAVESAAGGEPVDLGQSARSFDSG
jgi:predicted dehydrogenase